MEVRCMCTNASMITTLLLHSLNPPNTINLRRRLGRVRISPRAAINDDDDDDDDNDGVGHQPLLSLEERAKLSLRDLDNRLAELSQKPNIPANSPRVTYMTEDPEELKSTSNEQIAMPQQVSTGFLFFIGTALLLITVVNNLLFHYFIELPEEARLAQEGMKKEQLGVKNLDIESNAAPQLS